MTEQPEEEKPRFDASKLDKAWKTQPSQPAQAQQPMQPAQPMQDAHKISWRVWGGWLLAGFSWALLVTYLLLGVIH
jgi:hypothetical protein